VVKELGAFDSLLASPGRPATWEAWSDGEGTTEAAADHQRRPAGDARGLEPAPDERQWPRPAGQDGAPVRRGPDQRGGRAAGRRDRADRRQVARALHRA